MQSTDMPAVWCKINPCNLNALGLTEHGVKMVRSINKRNKIFVEFLVDVLGLDAATIKKDACQLEHPINNAPANQLAERKKTS